VSESWGQGYFIDTPYTRGFYPEQVPLSMGWASLMAGNEPPRIDRPFTYLELGAGQAQTAAIVAACHPQARVIAVDFNPDHIVVARRHAERCGLDNLELVDTSFADMSDLAIQADYVAIHGVLSWVSPQVTEDVVQVLASKMAAGGLVYISYNALPGRAATVSLQRLLLERYSLETGHAGERLEKTLAFASTLAEGPGYFKQHPDVHRHLEMARTRDRSYLPHEYLNEHWNPMFFADMERLAKRAKLTWVGSADPIRHVPSMGLTEKARAIVEPIENRTHRETVKDFLLDTRFRRDLFGRGRHMLPMSAQRRQILDQRFVLAKRREECLLQVRVPAGEVHLNADPYDRILDALALGPADGHELGKRLNGEDDQLYISLMVLSAVGYLTPAMPVAGREQRQERVDRYNQYWLRQLDEDSLVLGGPTTGLGLRLGRLEGLMTRGLIEGREDLAAFVFDTLDAAGQRLVLGDKRITDRTQAKTELRELEERFRTQRVPLLRGHGIVRG
jgi:predicted O-methyltransferase YrrM